MNTRTSYKIGGSEVIVTCQEVAGSDVYSLEIHSKSSLDYSSVVLNLTREEFKKLIIFFLEGL